MPTPQITPEQAKEALDEIYDRFTQPENKVMLVNLVKECDKEENPAMAKMMKFPPIISNMLKDLMDRLGFAENEIMLGRRRWGHVEDLHGTVPYKASSTVNFFCPPIM